MSVVHTANPCSPFGESLRSEGIPMSQRIKLSVVLLTALFFLTDISSALAEDRWALQEVVSGIRMRSELMSTLSAKMDRTIYNTAQPDKKKEHSTRNVVSRARFEVDQKFDKVRVAHSYLNTASGKLESINYFAWDGQRSRGYSDFPKPVQYLTGGLISAEQGSAYSLGYYLTVTEQRVFSLSQPLASIVDGATWKLVGIDQVGPYSTICLEGPAGPKRDLRVWVDPLHDFAPVRMRLTEHTTETIDVVVEHGDVILKQIDGVWVIVGCTISLNHPLVLPRDTWQCYEFTLNEVRVGHEIPDDHFVMKFPCHMRVLDSTTQLVCSVRQDGTLEPIFHVGSMTDPKANFSVTPELSEDFADSIAGSPEKDEHMEVGEGKTNPPDEPSVYDHARCDQSGYRILVVSLVAIIAVISLVGALILRRKRACRDA